MMQPSFKMGRFAVLGLLALAACSEGESARDILGLGRRSPDEFTVVSRPPLSIPPEFALRAPDPNATSPNHMAADAAARSVVMGGGNTPGTANTAVGTVTSAPLGSSGDEQFLSNAGATSADPDIRNALAESRVQTQKKKDNDDTWLFNWGKDDDAVIVDAEAEKARIQKNKKDNKPVTAGKTPEIEPVDRGVLGGLF